MPAAIEQKVTLSMLGELTTGAVSTAAGRNQFVTLERRWATESFGIGQVPSAVSFKLPRHNIESFATFMWLLSVAEM